jgi:ribose 5-phosphate isomerase B
MTIYTGADHGGFALKEKIKAALRGEGYEVIDMGAEKPIEDDDYPDYASAVARKVQSDPLNARGIVICRSGFGVDIVANKYDGVRAALATSPEHAYQGRHDDDVNVLALAADFIDEAVALKAAKVFLITPFAKEDKYSRRLEKIGKIEATN